MGPTRSGMETCARGGGSFLPAPPRRQKKGSPGPRIRAASARLTRRIAGAERLGARTGADPRAGVGWGERLQPASCPHRRPPPNPFTKPEPPGRKGGEDGGRKGGGVSGEGAAGPAARKPGDAADLSPPPDGGHGACTSREPVGVCGVPLDSGVPAPSAQALCSPPL